MPVISQRVIHKFPFPDLVGAPFVVMIPKEHTFLSVQEQMNDLDFDITLWAIVDPAHQAVKHEFKMVFTGQPFHDEDDYMFLGTIQRNNGLVQHVFKKIKGYAL